MEDRELNAPSSVQEGAFVWAVLLLTTVTCVVLWTNISRFRDPVGDKYVFVMAPGGADFFYPFAGARAILMGVNPYLHEVSELIDPWIEDRAAHLFVEGRLYRNFYPPSHFVPYLPLAWFVPDWREASRAFFLFNMALIAVLTICTSWLALHIGGPRNMNQPWVWLLVPLFGFILMCNVSTEFALERGQSDILVATLCWGGLVLFLRGWRFTPAFLVGCAVLMKMYATVFALGLGLFALERREWGLTLAGWGAAALILLAPVAGYIGDALPAVRTRANMYWNVWYNHGFKQVFESLAPGTGDTGKWSLCAFTIVIALGCWWAAKRARDAGSLEQVAFWLTLFGVTSHALFIGASNASMPYNLVMILPGVLLLLWFGVRFAAEYRSSSPPAHMLGVMLLVAGVLLFLFRGWSRTISLTGIGLVLLLVAIGFLVLLWRGSVGRGTEQVSQGVEALNVSVPAPHVLEDGRHA